MQEESFTLLKDAESLVYYAGMKKCSVQRQGIGARLTDLRIQAGLSQHDLAERIKVPLANIGFWERTGTAPAAKILPELAEALGTTVEELLTGKPQAIARKGGPTGRMKQLFEAASSLPRAQQQKVLDILQPFIREHVNQEAKA